MAKKKTVNEQAGLEPGSSFQLGDANPVPPPAAEAPTPKSEQFEKSSLDKLLDRATDLQVQCEGVKKRVLGRLPMKARNVYDDADDYAKKLSKYKDDISKSSNVAATLIETMGELFEVIGDVSTLISRADHLEDDESSPPATKPRSPKSSPAAKPATPDLFGANPSEGKSTGKRQETKRKRQEAILEILKDGEPHATGDVLDALKKVKGFEKTTNITLSTDRDELKSAKSIKLSGQRPIFWQLA